MDKAIKQETNNAHDSFNEPNESLSVLLNTENERLREMEKTVLGCLLAHNDLIDNVITKLKATDFLFFYHQGFYQAILQTHEEGKDINYDSIYNYFRNDEILSRKLNETEFNDLFDEINFQYRNIINYEFAVDFVKSAAIFRQTHQLANEFLNRQFNFSEDANLENFDFLRKFSDVIHSNYNTHIQKISDVIKQMQLDYDRIDERLGFESNLTGLDTGFKGINGLTAGFQKGDLIILAARPGTGKTALALNFLLHICRNLKKENEAAKEGTKKKIAVLFSIEMGAKQVLERMVAAISNIEIGIIKRGVFIDSDRIIINQVFDELSQLPLMIIDASDVSILDFQAKLKQLQSSYEISFVVLDYLQLLKGPQKKNARSFSRQEEVSNISRMLKVIARDISTPVLSLAQLSRKIEERRGGMDGENPKPLLSDLRESGSIEQDADLVTFLYYKRDPILNVSNPSPNGENSVNLTKPAPDKVDPYVAVPIQFTIEKHRNGPTGEVTLNFVKNISLFKDDEGETFDSYEKKI